MSDIGNSSFDPEPSSSDTTIHQNNEQKVSEIIKARNYRPGPASKKRIRKQNYVTKNVELFYTCKPLSVKLERLPQAFKSKTVKKSDQVSRTKRRNRWRNGFVDKSRKRTKTDKSIDKSDTFEKSRKISEKSVKSEKSEKAEKAEKSEKPEEYEKSSEANNTSCSSAMVPTHSWGCCRLIPFDRNRFRSCRRFSSSRNRDSIGPLRLKQETPNDKVSERPVSKIASRERISPPEDKRTTSKAKVNDTPIENAQNHNSHSTRSSITKEESTSKRLEDDCVCRRTIPYIRKTKCKPVFNSHIDTAQAGGSKNSTTLVKSVRNLDQTLKEPASKISKTSLKKERKVSETEEFSGCSKTESFLFKTKSREKERNHQELSNNGITSETCKKPLEPESKVCEKTDETKVPEPNVSRKNEDENMEDINFAWNSSNMWKYKRKQRTRRISSSSSSEEECPKKKAKISHTVDHSRLNERKPGPSCTHEKIKSHSAMRTLCPPSCTNREHHSNVFNFLYEKPKVIALKEGRVLLQRLEEMVNNPDVIRWRNRMIKLEKEEVEEEVEGDLEDSRYYVMYEDGTVSNEALSREAIYQMREMTDFNTIDESCQPYEKINTYEGELIRNCALDMSKYFKNTVDESQHLNNHMLEADVPKDDETLTDDHLLRDDDDVPLEFSQYPKLLLIRLETLVGSLETEYSASEIENLEVKYIDFMMNSNFSYDKQSQSFFQVYKRLHAKRARERELETLNADSSLYTDGDVLELEEMDQTDSRDDYIDEKPLVIALDAEREGTRNEEWVSDESSNAASADVCASSVDRDSEVATITPLPKDMNHSKVPPPSNNNKVISTDLVTCEKISEEVGLSKEELLFITCKFCKVSFKNLHTFTLHKTDCYVKNKKPLKCEYCSNFYKNRRTLKLHLQHVHGQGDSITESQKTSSNNGKEKISSSSARSKKQILRAAQQNLYCGVCSVEFDSKESLWDHILKHTERELQDAYNDATKNNKNQELQDKLRRMDQRRKDKAVESNQQKNQSKTVNQSKSVESRNDHRQAANKYAQWKDRILYKNVSNDEVDKNASTSRGTMIDKQTEEIILSSSESEGEEESNKHCENVDNISSLSRRSVIKTTKPAEDMADTSEKVITMCPCHADDTSALGNGDMQLEMVLLCEICQVLFRRQDCFEVHYRVNKLCSVDRTSNRTPKLFCSSCRIILNSLPEMRYHLEKHAKVNKQGHVTFLCNICKVMFFGVGSLFYSHWFNHHRDVHFLSSRYSFPKLSVIPIVKTNNKAGITEKEEYLFVAEYVCKNCKIPFGSETDLQKHACRKRSITDRISGSRIIQTEKNVVRMSCLKCNKVFANKREYDAHEKMMNHLMATKPEYICVSSDACEKSYVCVQCKTVRMSVKDFKKHWIFHQPWREKFTCSNCPDVRSSRYEQIEFHVKKCVKLSPAVCLVSLFLASYQCKPCNLHFETGEEWKDHREMCTPLSTFCKTSAESTAATSVSSAAASIATSTVASLVSTTASTTVTPTVTPTVTRTVTSTISPTIPTSIPITIAASTLIPVAVSRLSSNDNFVPILPKPVSCNLKFTPASLLEKYLMLSTTTPKPKSNSKNRVSQDVEVIDILSETSSRSSETEVSRDPRSVPEASSKDSPALNSNDQSSTLEVNPFDLYIPGNLAKKYQRKDVSSTKAVVCYPPKKKDGKRKQQLNPRNDPSFTSQTKSNTELDITSEDAERVNLAMTAVNPEFESLLSELESLGRSSDSAKTSTSLRDVRKKSTNKECNLETSLLNIPSAENSSTNRVSVEEVHISEEACPSVTSEITSSSKGAETLSPLPFEVVLLPDDEVDSPKSSAVSQTSTAPVDINSNKSTTSGSDQTPIDKKDTNNGNDKEASSESTTASIIEEYIEYIMMDESVTDNPVAQEKPPSPVNPTPVEDTPKVEKVAPSRLRVRSLAELQEIKMHLCDTCGQTFDAKETFEEHVRASNCERLIRTDFVKPPPPPYRQSFQDSTSSAGHSTEIDYRAALTQNLVRRGVFPSNMDFNPSSTPLAIQQLNASTSRSNMTPVSPNLASTDLKRRQSLLFRGQNIYSNNTGVITPSNSSRFNSSGSHSAPRSSAIQLPERTGGNVLQKRPSGAATRIQNVSHPPRSQVSTVIQHRGLPQTYTNRVSGRVSHPLGTPPRLPPPYHSSGSTPIRATLENPRNSLTCTTCNNYTAKNMAEFSAHLVMHYMESSTDPSNQIVNDNDNDLRNSEPGLSTNQEGQSIDPSSRNSPNTSGYQTSSITASDMYSGRSTAVTGGWQTPARYIYACQLCDFRTESKASIRLHEKNHSTVAVMRQKNLQRLQNQQMMQQAFQTQEQRQQSQPQLTPALTQLMEHHKQNQPNVDATPEKNAVVLYTRVSGDIFQCQLCNNFLFSTHDEFMRHLETSHKENRKEAVIEPPDSGTVCFVCDYCETPQIFESEVNLRKHMNFLHNYLCNICSQRCTSRELLQSHLLSHKLENQTQ